MDIVISHNSALDFWRTVYPTTRAPGSACEWCEFEELALRAEDVWSLAPSWVTAAFLEPEGGVLHTLGFAKSQKRRRSTHLVHTWSAAIPPGSFYDCGDGVYVCAPAFVFLQMASVLPTAQLAALACELCGLYSFDQAAPRGFRMRDVPLTTLDALADYVARARNMGLKGAARAADALEHALGRSASPMETACALLLTLPAKAGGYALPRPMMNHRIQLSGRALRLDPKTHCYGDCCWPDRKLDLEYLGRHDHAGGDAMSADRERTDALIAMDYTVVEVTARQVYDWQAFEAVALLVAKRLARRIRTEARGLSPARAELRKQIFDWNKACGRPARDLR